jgi:hypothetical protein
MLGAIPVLGTSPIEFLGWHSAMDAAAMLLTASYP